MSRVIGLRAILAFGLVAGLAGCGFKGPLVAADRTAPAGTKTASTSQVPDAGSAAPAASQDAERVIDEDKTPAP